MSMKLKTVLAGLAAVGLVSAIAAFTVFRTPAAPSEPLEAISLEVITQESEAADAQSAAAAADTPAEAASPEPVAETATTAATAETAESGDPLLYEIVQDQSQVQFQLEEDLRGVRTTVVGATGQVAGQIALDPADLSTAQVGVIQVNARTLETDNNFRNRAIQNEILDTGSYEYITFTPTAVEGLPDNAAVGETVSFRIIGDLTIRDITRQVTFDVTATLVSETELSGTASTTILREDYNLAIPSVPQVANVDERVSLLIDFLANAV